MQRSLLVVAALALLAAACGAQETAVPSSTSTLPIEGSQPDEESVVLLSGTIEVPAADAFGDPGFHEPFSIAGTIPESAVGVTGVLVVRLFDVGLPNQECGSNHPLSGCTTIDWSDFEDRPGVPAGGVFDNRLSVVSTSGAVDLFLSERRGLAATPDEYTPT